MASLQLTVQLKSDALAVMQNSQAVFVFNELQDKKDLIDSLTAAGNIDNMSCTKSQLELLQSKIGMYKGTGLTAEELESIEGTFVDGELTVDGLEQKIQAAIDAA